MYQFRTWPQVGVYDISCTIHDEKLVLPTNRVVHLFYAAGATLKSIPSTKVSTKDRHIVVHFIGYVFELLLIIFATFTSMEILDEVNR